MDARTLVNLMIPDRSVAAYHVYFPDPWPKERHTKHRLFTPIFVHNLARTISTRGIVHVATDVEDRSKEIFAMLEDGGFEPSDAVVPGASETGFARKYLAAGRPIFARAYYRA